MKHIIILGDGMADHAEPRLGGKSPLQYATTPNMDRLAALGRNGRLITVEEGFHPGSEVANMSVLGYDLRKVYEGRGVLEAASIGVDLQPGEMAMRCNLVTIEGDLLKNHSAGHISTSDADILIRFLQERLGSERVRFYSGVSYRHLLVIKGGDKRIVTTPPHDVPLHPWWPLLVKAAGGSDTSTGRAEAVSSDGAKVTDAAQVADGAKVAGAAQVAGAALTPEETASLLNDLIVRSQELLREHPLNKVRVAEGKEPANSIWPWSPGYRPEMEPISKRFPSIKSGSVITAVDLIRGIGKYAGLKVINVEGATGLYDTNYENKVAAAIRALREDDFLYLHIEASDEAGHDGDLELKLKTIENLDSRVVGPLYEELKGWREPVAIAILPDHPTPCSIRTHTAEPVPFLIYKPGMKPDSVMHYDEESAKEGIYGVMRRDEFINEFMK